MCEPLFSTIALVFLIWKFARYFSSPSSSLLKVILKQCMNYFSFLTCSRFCLIPLFRVLLFYYFIILQMHVTETKASYILSTAGKMAEPVKKRFTVWFAIFIQICTMFRLCLKKTTHHQLHDFITFELSQHLNHSIHSVGCSFLLIHVKHALS